MRAFAALHPLTLVVYFMAVLLPMALCMHPVLLALSLLGCTERGGASACGRA